MASWQSRVLRAVLRYHIGPKFRRAGISVAALREAMGYMAGFAKVPPETRVEEEDLGGVRAEWVAGPSSRSDRVVYYLHGGGCIMGRPSDYRELAARIASAAQARVLLPDYRLAPEHPYPAALDDGLTGYRWLLDSGLRPESIAIGGDSAGGGLTLQTLLTLREEGEPLPAAAVFLSPLTDWIHFDGDSYRTRAKTDPWLTEALCRLVAAYYVCDADRDDPLLSPVRADLGGLPPMLVQVADDEVLLDDAIRLAHRARRAGGDVSLSVWPNLWHVFQGSASSLPEARDAIDGIGEFLRSRLA
ncbi:MAG: alpha/beta hydrolase [Deltaproteobacteria bacterium]|jgi:acetyl esterase/lipase|nr:alpha/beta hydrolase [Deltaproteobacteria bacterium]MBW2530738.1 alpha/beta hydrolase [Deltaproteobacteria bacterium]